MLYTLLNILLLVLFVLSLLLLVILLSILFSLFNGLSMILVPTFNSVEYDLDCFCILISDCDGVIMYTDSLAYIHCRFDTRYSSAKYVVENILTEDRVSN